MSVNIAYEFTFQTKFSELAYGLCPDVLDADVKDAVKEAVSSILVVLRRFTGLARMSKLIPYKEKMYKVTVTRPV